MKVDIGNLPPHMTEPPPGAPGLYAFQPATWKIWQKIESQWLPIAEAQKRINSRTPN
jgi:prolyl-tRNA synthetase